MKKSLLILFLAGCILPAFGQDYPQLLELLVDEKYEKLLRDAERATVNEETRSDPMPYLYMSMAYRAIDLADDDPELQEKYPKAFKEAVKFAVKHRKKDKQNLYYEEYVDFFDELRLESSSEAFGYIGSEKYTKAKGVFKNLTKMDDGDAGAWMMKASMEYLSKSTREASLSFAKAKELIEGGSCDRLTTTQMNLLRDGLIYTAEMLDGEGNNSEASEWLNLGLSYFTDNEEYMVTYEMIVG